MSTDSDPRLRHEQVKAILERAVEIERIGPPPEDLSGTMALSRLRSAAIEAGIQPEAHRSRRQ